jgi:hypothetical protein
MSMTIIPQTLKPVRVGTRIVGYIEDGVFHKKVKGSRHQLKVPPAWCISSEAFDDCILPSCDQIVVEDQESGITYRVSTVVFQRHCFRVERGNFEPQLGLAMRHWTIERPGEAEQLAFALTS